MDEVECPYCNHSHSIDHDDGYGYEEDQIYHQQCPKCERYFVFSTYITFSYTVNKADCLNGGQHRWKEIWRYPRPEKPIYRCTDCGEIKHGKQRDL